MRGIIEHHIIPAIGAIKLKQLSSIHIQRMYNDLKENGRMPRGAKQNDKPLSNTFVRRVHAVLQAALKQAVKERHKRSDGNGYFGGACVPAFGRGNVRRGNCGCSGEREEKSLWWHWWTPSNTLSGVDAFPRPPHLPAGC